MSSSTLPDRLLSALKNNRYLGTIIVIATIIGAIAQFTNSLTPAYDKVQELLGLDARHRAIYRPLAADLGNLEIAMNSLGSGETAWPVVQLKVHMIQVAADPVCHARKGVSELGDANTRQELDRICTAVELIKKFGDPQSSETPTVAQALALEMATRVKELREHIIARV